MVGVLNGVYVHKTPLSFCALFPVMLRQRVLAAWRASIMPQAAPTLPNSVHVDADMELVGLAGAPAALGDPEER